jgi:hypothetical protein
MQYAGFEAPRGRRTGKAASAMKESLRVCRQMDVLHFGDGSDGDRVSAGARKNVAGDFDVFAYEGQQAFSLIDVGHGCGDGNVNQAVLRKNDEGRAVLRALHGALKVEISGAGFFVLDGAGNVADKALNGDGRFVVLGRYWDRDKSEDGDFEQRA